MIDVMMGAARRIAVDVSRGENWLCSGQRSRSSALRRSISGSSVTSAACAAIDSPCRRSGVSWPSAIEIRGSRAMFASFWLVLATTK